MSVTIEVAPVAEFPPGTRRSVEIRGREVIVFNLDGEFFAVRNHCPHQGGPVAEGPITKTTMTSAREEWVPQAALHDRVLRCPWHALEFDVATGLAVCNPRWRVRTYRTRVTAGVVEVVA
jgi:3-phenylpropionate/trans-cinnamate dioxygenase ferredoxin subunit